jgi:hypothetical protein
MEKAKNDISGNASASLSKPVVKPTIYSSHNPSKASRANGATRSASNSGPALLSISKQQGPVATAASVTSAPWVSRPNGVVQQTEQASPKATAMAQALYGSEEQPLRYRNGILVDKTNEAEVAAFGQYQVEKKGDPQSRPQLRTYMRQKQAM